ncbi:MAG: S-methyl-5-thioribose-1-phosphate isomerase [Candidatus Diapherotrites archaeon]|uniref:Putative methylthioribose-1-phosphate isomerase n=1 Tax=Candidatus Iainarchaeum sp. TaxID=3101447 RepID=A0A8T4LGM3_9ARCH|nr:S-methyl-5-thioribose-1-phosphate isomerase [Candidatus Diapherotrites archaeon]
MRVKNKPYRAVWLEDRTVKAIDQRLLPHRFKVASLRTHRDTAIAIREMLVRGAGTIGATAAYGLAQACLEAPAQGYADYVYRAYEALLATRPTAIDLKHALDRVIEAVKDADTLGQVRRKAAGEANAIAADYVVACQAIARHGLPLVKKNARVLTHCNAGWLAIVDWGSATAPIYLAQHRGRKPFVYVDETRPRLQGAQLTAWELGNEKVRHAVIVDNAAGHFMQRGLVDLVVVGADRIAANGDVANKIGTYEKAVLARENGVPFYVAAPTSTISLETATGKDIPIEERSLDEVLCLGGKRLAPVGSQALNPAFDVTPARFVSGIVTEKGIVKAKASALKKLLG